MSVDRETFIDFAALAIITGQVGLCGDVEIEKAYQVAEEVWRVRKKVLGIVEVELRNGMPVGDVARFTTGFVNDDKTHHGYAMKLQLIAEAVESSHPSTARRTLDEIREILA